MYLLVPKIYKSFNDVPGCLVISNCDNPTEKLSEFLDRHLQPIMKARESFLRKATFWKSLEILVIFYLCHISYCRFCGPILLYPSRRFLSEVFGLQALYEKLEERADKKIPSIDLAEMVEFILKQYL